VTTNEITTQTVKHIIVENSPNAHENTKFALKWWHTASVLATNCG